MPSAVYCSDLPVFSINNDIKGEQEIDCKDTILFLGPIRTNSMMMATIAKRFKGTELELEELVLLIELLLGVISANT